MLFLSQKVAARVTVCTAIFISSTSSLFAQQQTRAIDEVQVKSSRKLKPLKLGAAHCFSTFSFSPGYLSSVVVHLKPSLPARLTEVEIGMPALFGADGTFRLLVLSPQNGLPGEPLLTDTVLLSVRKGQRFCSVSLDTFNLRADTAGIFVGVEWMTKYERQEKGAPQHLALKMVRCDDAAETFVSFPHLGRLGWQRFAEMEARAEGGSSFTRAAISGTFIPLR